MCTSTWAMPRRSFVRIVQPYSGTILHLSPTRHARRNAHCRTRRTSSFQSKTEARAVAAARSVMIAGAGIGGLTAALALAQHGLGVAIFDQAQTLEEIGAGIQLSPNESRIRIGLGLANELQRHVVAPEELRVLDARTARVLVRAALGAQLLRPTRSRRNCECLRSISGWAAGPISSITRSAAGGLSTSLPSFATRGARRAGARAASGRKFSRALRAPCGRRPRARLSPRRGTGRNGRSSIARRLPIGARAP